MKRILLLVVFVFVCAFSFAQERLLSMKIVYEVPIMKATIERSPLRDSIVYDYLVDKRFWWQMIDKVNAMAKNRKLELRNFKGNVLNYDTVLAKLTLALEDKYKKKFTPNEVQKLIEEEIRVLKFEEQWYYDETTMLIQKRVLAFNPVIIRDTILFEEDEPVVKENFRYELGWVKPLGEILHKDTVVVARNIEFSIPIYNKEPYRWWDSHLEAEYSIPFLDALISKADNGKIKAYEDPSSSQELIKPEILKRRQFDVLETLVLEQDGNTIEKDTIIKSFYESERIDNFRFGEEWLFDQININIIKNTNYFAPLVRIIGKQGDFRGMYPLYYIRRR